eukprot:scaffold3801_cov150-Skeletonema_menzelii.AAC.8
MLMVAFKDGLVSKENLASALRAHQAAIDATKSPQREAAEIRGDECEGEISNLKFIRVSERLAKSCHCILPIH